MLIKSIGNPSVPILSFFLFRITRAERKDDPGEEIVYILPLIRGKCEAAICSSNMK